MGKEYKYYYNSQVFRVADGQAERYVGNGVWEPVKSDIPSRMDPQSEDYDFGETMEETPEEAARLIKSHDFIIETRKKNGWYDDKKE